MESGVFTARTGAATVRDVRSVDDDDREDEEDVVVADVSARERVAPQRRNSGRIAVLL
jgi:hypothetical protein